ERIEPIILVGDVQQANARFSVTIEKAVADENIELPKIITGQVRRISVIALSVPKRFSLAEKAGGMIVNRKQVQLMQNRFDVAARRKSAHRARAVRDIREVVVQLGLAETIARAEGPFVADELAERHEKGAFVIIELLRRGIRGDGKAIEVENSHLPIDFGIQPLAGHSEKSS